MQEIKNAKEFVEWLRYIAQNLEEGSTLIRSVKTGIKPSKSGGAVKRIEIEFNVPTH